MVNQIQGDINITGQVHLRAHARPSIDSIQTVKERLGVETKYVDVTIQVRFCRYGAF